MPHRYSTALSHIILAGTSIYCYTFYHGGGFRFPQISYGLLITNSLIGIWRWGNPEHGDSADRIYRCTSFLETIFVLPFITTELWLDYGYGELSYIHAGMAIIPLLQYLADRVREDLIDVILSINVLSLGAISFAHENYFGLATAISYALDYFFIRSEASVFDIPAQDLYNYGLCFFAYLAVKSLGDSNSVAA